MVTLLCDVWPTFNWCLHVTRVTCKLTAVFQPGFLKPGEGFWNCPTLFLTITFSRCPNQADRYLTNVIPVDGSSGLEFLTHYKRFAVQMFTFVDADSLAPLKDRVLYLLYYSRSILIRVSWSTAGVFALMLDGFARKSTLKAESVTMLKSSAVNFRPVWNGLGLNG